MFRHLKGLVAFTAALMLPFVAAAQSVSDHLGPVPGEVGTDGPWESSLTGGWFLMSNYDDPGAIKFFYATSQMPNASDRDIGATIIVLPEGGDRAYGGLLFDYAANDDYAAFLIRSDGVPVVLTRTPDGHEEAPYEDVRARLDGSDVLEIRQKGNKAELVLNGAVVVTLDDNRGYSPAFGVIALGKGRMGFDGFNVEEKLAQAPLPTPGGGQSPLPKPGGGQSPLPKPGGQAPLPQPGNTGGGQTEDPFEGASPEDIYAAKVLMGTTLGIFFHELGHAIVGELSLPATGSPEDVADRFSAYVLTAAAEEAEMSQVEKAFFTDIVKYASLLWYYSGVQMERAGKREPWQDEHMPSLTRFRSSFCIVYGSNPGSYEDVANTVQFGDRAKARCKNEYKFGYNAWETILKTVSRDLGPDAPGDHPANTPGGNVVLTFTESNQPFGDAVEALLRDTGTMQQVVADMSKTFVWPRDLAIEFKDCGEINAWYDPGAGKVTMCYDAIEYFSNIVFKAEGAATGGQTGGQTGGGQTGGGQQPGGTPQNEAVAYLSGVWATTIPAQGMQIEIAAEFAPNGQYQIVTYAGNQTIQVQGQWAAEVRGQNEIAVQLNPTQWSPQQICDGNGNCQPNTQVAEVLTVYYVDDNTLSSDGVNWRRQR